MPATRVEMRFAVVRIDNGIRNPHTGVVGTHKTRAAAEKFIRGMNAYLQTQPGCSNSWHPFAILDLGTYEVTLPHGDSEEEPDGK